MITSNLEANKESIEILIKWLRENPVAPFLHVSKTTTVNKKKPYKPPETITETKISNCKFT